MHSVMARGLRSRSEHGCSGFGNRGLDMRRESRSVLRNIGFGSLGPNEIARRKGLELLLVRCRCVCGRGRDACVVCFGFVRPCWLEGEMIPAILACALSATLYWDEVKTDVEGKPEVIVKSEVEIRDGKGLVAKVEGGPASADIGPLVEGRAPGSFTLFCRVADAAGNWSAWSAPLPYVIEAPKPTKVVISWRHDGRDLNGQAVTITTSEARIFAAGSGPSGEALGVVSGPGSGLAGQLEISATMGVQLVAGYYSAFVRVRSAAGWSSYSPSIPFRWPPSEPQPQAPPLKATVPARAIEVTSEVKP